MSQSVFASTMHAAGVLQSAGPLPLGHSLIAALAQTGCHHPLFASTDMNITEAATANTLAAAMAALLTQAGEDAGHAKLIVKPVVWENKETGRYLIGMAAGTKTPDEWGGDFPAQAVVQELKALRTEIFGASAENPGPHWEIDAMDDGNGLLAVYRWKATGGRDEKLQPIAEAIIHMQKARHSTEGRPGEMLTVPKQELEAAARRELGGQAPAFP